MGFYESYRECNTFIRDLDKRRKFEKKHEEQAHGDYGQKRGSRDFKKQGAKSVQAKGTKVNRQNSQISMMSLS